MKWREAWVGGGVIVSVSDAEWHRELLHNSQSEQSATSCLLKTSYHREPNYQETHKTPKTQIWITSQITLWCFCFTILSINERSMHHTGLFFFSKARCFAQIIFISHGHLFHNDRTTSTCQLHWTASPCPDTGMDELHLKAAWWIIPQTHRVFPTDHLNLLPSSIRWLFLFFISFGYIK